MEQKKTASEMLAQIENDFFRITNIAEASLLGGDERRAFILPQVERLLTETNGSEPLALYLSDMFWTADERGMQPENPDSLMSLKEQQTLTEEEKGRLLLIEEVAGLCHDLSLHYAFDLKAAFGVKNVFWVSNKQLVEWLSNTEYERIAMHTAYIMRKDAISVYANDHYLPAQDELAELYSMKYHCLVGNPVNTKIPPRDYVRTILDALLQIERHWRRGRRLKLNPEVVILHDEIYGMMPRRFDKKVLKVAQALYDYMDKEVYGKATNKVLEHFAEKVRKVSAQYLSEGWLADDSLAFGYLMAHAERCAQGIWRKEDEAL